MNMRKMRSDSTWNRLSAEQRLRFEGWLFDENLSYEAVRERAEKEFGLTGSVDSIGRYYRARSEMRNAERTGSGQVLARLLSGTTADADTIRAASQKALGMRFLETTLEGADVKEICALGRLVLNSERRDMDRERLELSRDRHSLAGMEQMLELEKFKAFYRSDPEKALTTGAGTAAKCG